MKIHFLGANRQVTGSRYCIETDKSKVMIDCGLFQERQYATRNWHDCPIPPNEIDALVLTHAHIDHCGLIPRHVKHGFNGPIYMTHPTADLLEIMLKDSAHIQAEDAAYKQKRHRREGRKKDIVIEPLYDAKDVDETLPLVQGVPYGQVIEVRKDVHVRFLNAGHILGSAILEVVVEEDGRKRTVVFSGDIGQWGKPIIKDPTMLDSADYVVMESTYGDRLHKDGGDIAQQFEQVIKSTISAGGNVVIPTFAVERAQEIIYYIGELRNQNRIPKVPVFLDSPMAVDVTKIFKKHRSEFDSESWQRIDAGDSPLHFDDLHMARTTAQSIAINESRQPAIIMSTSGMCTAGRIKHHLKHNISRAESTVLFVGYQAHGTLGRQIVERKKKEVRIHGKSYPLRCGVSQIFGFSGHADRDDLLRWAYNFPQPTRIFLTHGDEEAAEALAATIRKDKGWDVLIPDYDSTSDLG